MTLHVCKHSNLLCSVIFVNFCNFFQQRRHYVVNCQLSAQEIVNWVTTADECVHTADATVSSRRRCVWTLLTWRVQEHIIKMYDNVASLKFVRNTSGDLVVIALVSAEKEEMDLLNHVMTDSRVEEWMNVVLQEMRLANRKITKRALFYYCDNMTRLEWMMKYQV